MDKIERGPETIAVDSPAGGAGEDPAERLRDLAALHAMLDYVAGELDRLGVPAAADHARTAQRLVETASGGGSTVQ